MAYTEIDRSSEYFETKLYTGTGATNAITGVGFAPDFVWCKNRQSALYHGLYDVVRGTGTTKGLSSNSNEAEGANANFINLTSFDSDGFTLGATVSTNQINTSGENHVAWNWKANGAGVSNTDGTISSTVSANTTSGFSIVSYTGNGTDNATVGHGLGSSINFVIVKRRNTTSNWLVQGSKVGTGYGQYLELNSTGAISTASDNIKSVSSSTLTLGTNGSCNTLSDTYIAYCFAEKKGFSKFGSYTGNGSADGTFVYTGMRPAFVMIKDISSTDPWHIIDNKRSPINLMNARLFPSNSNAENTSADICDFVSNGIKFRGTNDGFNGSRTYIYMAFAEHPFVTSTSVPTTAR